MYDVIAHRPHRTDRETAAGKAQRYHHRPEINLHASYHVIRDESTIHSRRPLQIRPEQPTPPLQNCHAHSLKTAKTL